ncbi:hypothetical protein [Hymenobacter rubripertinctus]|uniref:Uncharacterized protein n=1 Tax=Hymenobacter rubripertinctus TaxID=2029981 RepID=A0A418QWL8_9BACT|nr:hypothetical protein [Hymenobacter rubripertinctus]RIY09579.1 hypothetical protein D0T11_12220 [Hymenobacter rubripertinctus]
MPVSRRYRGPLLLFSLAMVLFHYHSTVHFFWSLVGIKATFPLDPTDGWWALLKGFLPFGAMSLVFFAGTLTKKIARS